MLAGYRAGQILADFAFYEYLWLILDPMMLHRIRAANPLPKPSKRVCGRVHRS